MSVPVSIYRFLTLRASDRLPLWWIAILLLWFVLVLPAHPEQFVMHALLALPLELPILILALLYLPERINTLFRTVLVVCLVSLIVLRLADVGSYHAFDRAFSPLVEWHLLGDGWNLASSTVGRTKAATVIGLLLLLLIGFVWLLATSLNELSRLQGLWRSRLIISAAALVLLSVSVLTIERLTRQDWPVFTAGIPGEAVQRIQAMHKSINDQNAFVTALAEDPVLVNGEPLFNAVAGRDVLVLFVESYGRSFLDLEPMRSTALPRLAISEAMIADAGLALRSGWLESPIRGGRSWLAHASFMSGLHIDNQARFDRLITSDRVSLNRLFGAAGWRTVGLMPAIQFAWPEGRWYGFDKTLTMRDFGYRGEPFDWVTMPDQYTLSALQQLRERTDKPLMAEVALISSHVPWTPIPKVVPWDVIEDGRVFNGTQRFEPPIVWKDRPGVQALYSQSLEYSLRVVTEYIARFADDALIIVLGDHQPASIIDGWGKTADVPVHFISRDASLLARLPDAHFSNGMIPGAALPSLPMESVRSLVSRVFEE